MLYSFWNKTKKRTRFVAVEELKTLVISKSEHTLSTDLGQPSTQFHKMQKSNRTSCHLWRNRERTAFLHEYLQRLNPVFQYCPDVAQGHVCLASR